MTAQSAGRATATGSAATRTRDAAASRQALLDAARELFGQRGFEGTTVRDIGERAGVDAALIARYFGGKADLYIAAIVAEATGYRLPEHFGGLGDMAEAMLRRNDEQGVGPVTQALLRADVAEEIGQAARAHMARRLVEPLEAHLQARGADRPRLRAEFAVAAMLGVAVGRTQGWFDELSTAPREVVVALMEEWWPDTAVGPRAGNPDPQ